jgi:peptidoglycan/xylan/chitin deacetylase (PgdA/CDA1 family)
MQFRSHHFRSLSLFALSSLSFAALAGCRKQEVAAPPPPKPAGPPKVSQADIDKHKPNEAGAVMVIMYHRILADEPNNDLNRKPETFRNDLKLLRDKGYHPVTALELVTNTMDVPAGKTPVVITFDDALPSQFKLVTGRDGKPHIDPNCAVGIMETFSKQNPDWPTKATFFVLPSEGRNGEPFGEAEAATVKFDYLVKRGYEIANHTSTHDNLRGKSAQEVQKELALAVKRIREIAPKASMQTFALPYGKLPRNAESRKMLEAGSSEGIVYDNKAVFLAAWRPILSPITKNDKKATEGGSLAVFDPYRLERVTPDARNASSPGTLEYWIKYFDKSPSLRYISDGNPKVATVPASSQSKVDASRVATQGQTLQVYGGAGEAGGKSKNGSSLSVE